MPNPTIVKSQSEFDAAASRGDDWIRIDSPRGVSIKVATPPGTEVEASGNSSVSAYGSSSVRAPGNSSVSAYGNSSVSAYGNSSVSASSHVAVHLHSGRAHIQGGVLIDHTDVDLTELATWLDYEGIAVTDGVATLYKAVDSDLNAGHGYTLTRYEIGQTVTADDWDPTARCGGGLHATGDPGLSEAFYNGEGRCRYLELAVPVEDMVPIGGDKVKFRSCTVVREVTFSGAPLPATTETAAS